MTRDDLSGMTPTLSNTNNPLEGFLGHVRSLQQVVDAELNLLLPTEEPDLHESDLVRAMRYTVLGGGKRFRPFLVMEVASLFDVRHEYAVRAACALELIHAFSLCHDDLPCMDNADLRRGQPSVHVAFGEATAVLAGDALQALAFELLAHPATCADAKVRADIVLYVAKAVGHKGMCAGQLMDLVTENQRLDMSTIIRLQRLKTGRLIDACCTVGALLGHASPQEHTALQGYAHDLGLAYQITDDLLDLEASIDEVGKPVGTDDVLGKATLVNLLGQASAREHAAILVEQAIGHLESFDHRADQLRNLARYILVRRS